MGTGNPTGKPSYLTAEITERVAEPLRRGASFTAACRNAGIPPVTGRYWLYRGRQELEEWQRDHVDEGDLPDPPPSRFAAFTMVVEKAMGEATVAAADLLWHDSPATWLRWSYARDDFHPMEAKLAAQAEARVNDKIAALLALVGEGERTADGAGRMSNEELRSYLLAMIESGMAGWKPMAKWALDHCWTPPPGFNPPSEDTAQPSQPGAETEATANGHHG